MIWDLDTFPIISLIIFFSWALVEWVIETIIKRKSLPFHVENLGKLLKVADTGIDSLEITSNALNKDINYELYLVSDTSSVDLTGSLNFDSKKEHAYKFTGNFFKINFQKVEN